MSPKGCRWFESSEWDRVALHRKVHAFQLILSMAKPMKFV